MRASPPASECSLFKEREELEPVENFVGPLEKRQMNTEIRVQELAKQISEVSQQISGVASQVEKLRSQVEKLCSQIETSQAVQTHWKRWPCCEFRWDYLEDTPPSCECAYALHIPRVYLVVIQARQWTPREATH